jgi:hypothetical protein
MKTTAQRKRERKAGRKERLYGPVGFLDFIWSLPCLKCGQGPSRAHHDPTAANGGTWEGVTPLCDRCHVLDSRSRHRHPGGHVGFWADLNTTREAEARKIQIRYREATK